MATPAASAATTAMAVLAVVAINRLGAFLSETLRLCCLRAFKRFAVVTASTAASAAAAALIIATRVAHALAGLIFVCTLALCGVVFILVFDGQVLDEIDVVIGSVG
ncbi:MAG: hypothetical protein WCP82_09115, partial [Alphaproteobacteria bacterium]